MNAIAMASAALATALPLNHFLFYVHYHLLYLLLKFFKLPDNEIKIIFQYMHVYKIANMTKQGQAK